MAIEGFIITPHAQDEMVRRGITEDNVWAVVSNPEQETKVRSGRVVMQSRIVLEDEIYLVRLFVDVDR